MGNTCYINSIVQCLYNIDYMTNFVLFAHRIKPYEPNSLADLYVQLAHAIHTLPAEGSANYITAKQHFWDNQLTKFIDKAWYEMTKRLEPGESARWRQADASEFFVTIVDNLVTQDTRYKSASNEAPLRVHPLGKVIKIENASIRRCPSIQFSATTQEVFTHLDIESYKQLPDGSIEPFSTLEQCMDSYYKKEILDDPNNYYKLDLSPEQLQKQPNLRTYQGKTVPNCEKELKIAELSDIVIIVPKRFRLDYETFQTVKLTHAISTPLTMSFRKYFTGAAQTKKLYKYDLIAAAEHMGTAGGGHYVAHVKEHSTGQWYYCSDSTINAETQEDASSAINTSYVLIYKKNEKKPDLPAEKKRHSLQERHQQGTVAQALHELTKALNNLRSVL